MTGGTDTGETEMFMEMTGVKIRSFFLMIMRMEKNCECGSE